jgi:uncharacterized protein (DUF1697 family)
MPKYIAFLRAINVGGHIIKMEHLRSLFESLGFENVETFIASGNVIFETAAKNRKPLEKQIEEHLHKALGYEVATFLRTDGEVREVAEYQPFPETNMAEAIAFNIGFLKEPLSDEGVQSLLALQTVLDEFHVNNRELYWLIRARQSDSKFSNAVFERTLKMKATFRGRNTLIRLAAKYPKQ